MALLVSTIILYAYFCGIDIMVSFSQSTYSISEDAGPIQPVLVLSNPSSFESTVKVFNIDGTATGE